MDNKVLEAEKQFTLGNLEACETLVNNVIAVEDKNVEALMLRAKLNYNRQKWGDALNDLNRILEIDSNYELAKNYKQIVLNILNFWNKDNYNP